MGQTGRKTPGIAAEVGEHQDSLPRVLWAGMVGLEDEEIFSPAGAHRKGPSRALAKGADPQPPLGHPSIKGENSICQHNQQLIFHASQTGMMIVKIWGVVRGQTLLNSSITFKTL